MKMHMKRWGLVLMILFFPASSPVSAWAQGVIDLPETGQITCYDTAGVVIPCLGTGQDGDWQAGVVWPSPRFTDNSNGTLTDNLTGLIWLKKANCFVGRTWATALTDADALNSGECGLTDGSVAGDWRLPNVNELKSLINAEQATPATWLNGQGFSGVAPNRYWSSSTYAVHTGNAWRVNLGDGLVFANLKTLGYYAWPVRAATTPPAELGKTGQTTSYAVGDDGDLERGVAWPVPRFTDNSNGTVTDNLTGLIWLKDANCFVVGTWAPALTDANTLNSGECGLTDGSVAGDWRLPNVNELRSLINAEQANTAPWLNGQGFSNVQSGDYWSSSTVAVDTVSAWVVSLYDGSVYAYLKTDSLYVWAVRAGTGGGADIAGNVAVGGAPVAAGTKVKLKNLATGVVTKTTTDAAGAYQFDPVASGSYKITIGLFEVGAPTTVTGNLTVKGVPSAGTKLKLKNLDTGVLLKTTTDAGGNFSFAGVTPGTHKVIIPTVAVP